MQLYYKTYNVASGFLEYKFWYDESLAGIFDDFTVTNMGPLKQGFDDGDNIELAIYPANINITINDFVGDNYTKFETLRKMYAESYPFNFDEVFKLEILLNGVQEFEGILDELSSVRSNPKDNNQELKLELSFVDGINKLKEIEIGNPYVLDKLFKKGIISRSQYYVQTIPPTPKPVYAYGFGRIGYLDNIPGYYITDINGGDRDTNLQTTIEQILKLLRPTLNVDFQNEFLFSDSNPDSSEVDITKVKIRRILSNLLGRYVVLGKGVERTVNIISSPGDEEYTKAQYFEPVFEDDSNIVYWHNFSGNSNPFGTKKWEKGLAVETINEILKVIAKNLFSYYGFIDSNNVFFRHRRYLSTPEMLTNILSMEKLLTVEKVKGVKIDDYYTGNYAVQGNQYASGKGATINYKIPLNAFNTDFGQEYRLIYTSGGNEYPVIYFRDLQNNYKYFPQDVIAKAEWEAYRQFRNQYKIVRWGVDKTFPKSYRVDKDNYHCTIKPIEIERDFFTNETTIIGLELDNFA